MKDTGSVLLIDMGSASVGMALAEPNKAGVPVISKVKREEFENTSGMNTPALTDLATAALRRCLVGAGAYSTPQEAHVVLAAPWYKASISRINSETERPVRITEGTIEKALESYKRKNLASTPGRQLIESVATQTYVNGYATTVEKPVAGSTLAIDYYESEADAPFLAAIEAELRKAFPGATVSFHSFLFEAFAVLRAVRDESGFVLLDIGGEITDAAIVRQGGFSFIGSFPYGALSFVRSVSDNLHGTSANAASRSTLFVKGELSTEETSSFREVFLKAAGEWENGYRRLLESAALEIPVPHTTFIIADKEPLGWFEHILSDSDAPFPVHPTLIVPDFFKNAVLLGQEGNYDAFLSIAALYALSVHR